VVGIAGVAAIFGVVLWYVMHRISSKAKEAKQANTSNNRVAEKVDFQINFFQPTQFSSKYPVQHVQYGTSRPKNIWKIS
jgi:hypothetical protein